MELSSSYILIADAFNNLFDLANIPAFIALLCVGIFLGCVRNRLPQSIGLCIGIHAGWVFTIKMTSAFFDRNKQSDWLFLTSSYDYVIGPLVSFWLILMTLALLYYTSRRPIRNNVTN